MMIDFNLEKSLSELARVGKPKNTFNTMISMI